MRPDSKKHEKPELSEISFYYDVPDGFIWEICFSPLPLFGWDVSVNTLGGSMQWHGFYKGDLSEHVANALFEWYWKGSEGVLPAGFVIPARDTDTGDVIAIGL